MITQQIDQGTLSQNLNQYFEYFEAKPEFFEQDFFTERHKLGVHEQKQAKAIFLKGISRRFKSQDIELDFLKMWQERQKSTKKSNIGKAQISCMNLIHKKPQNSNNKLPIIEAKNIHFIENHVEYSGSGVTTERAARQKKKRIKVFTRKFHFDGQVIKHKIMNDEKKKEEELIIGNNQECRLEEGVEQRKSMKQQKKRFSFRKLKDYYEQITTS